MKRWLIAMALPAFATATEPVGPNGHRWVRIAAGEYSLGSPAHVTNKPHLLKTAGFRIADAETTNAQFAAFVQATGYRTLAERNGWSLAGGEGSAEWEWVRIDGANWRQPLGPAGVHAENLPDHPVTQICGEDARAYCKWLGGRLPTIDEWEAAARGGVTTRFPWGEKFDDQKANIWNGDNHRRNTREDGFVLTAPVRSFPPNAIGLHDAVGNVFEYCEGHPPWMATDQSANRICGRGGSWWCSKDSCGFFNLLDIGSMVKTASLPNQGFRVAMDL
jgi:formylglycine-generating enzyme